MLGFSYLLVGVRPLALFFDSSRETLLGGVSEGVLGSLDLQHITIR